MERGGGHDAAALLASPSLPSVLAPKSSRAQRVRLLSGGLWLLLQENPFTPLSPSSPVDLWDLSRAQALRRGRISDLGPAGGSSSRRAERATVYRALPLLLLRGLLGCDVQSGG